MCAQNFWIYFCMSNPIYHNSRKVETIHRAIPVYSKAILVYLGPESLFLGRGHSPLLIAHL